MSNTEVKAWDTEDGDIVVWGTHDPIEGLDAWVRYMVEDAGFSIDSPEVSVANAEDFRTPIKLWGSPELLEFEDRWQGELVSTEPQPNWVPYMVVIL